MHRTPTDLLVDAAEDLLQSLQDNSLLHSERCGCDQCEAVSAVKIAILAIEEKQCQPDPKNDYA
jgi:hypothetical protein